MGCRLPDAPSTTIGVSSLYSGAAATCALVNSSVMLSFLLTILPNRIAFQSTTILRLPTPRKPPKSITAARTCPLRSTMTSTMRPMSSFAALSTSRPSTPCASLAPMIVTDGGGAAFFGVTGTDDAGGCAVGGAFASVAGAGDSSAARDTASVIPPTITTPKANHPAVRMHPPSGAPLARQHDRDLNLATRAQHLQRHVVAMAADAQVHAGLAQAQIAQDHLVQKRRQMRIAQPDLAARHVELDAQRRLQQRERGCARPGLRRAGDRIERRAAPLFAPETAEQFGQPAQVHVGRGVEQSLEDMRDRMLEPITREPERDQRIVVRPDRPVMIGHRIVTHLALRDGADAPAREEMRPHQIGGDEARAVLADHAAEQDLAGVGGPHLAGPLLAVECKRIGAELLAPERGLETLGQRLALGLELPGKIGFAEPERAARGEPLGGKDVTLHLGQREIAFRELAIGMEDRVVGILPALVGEALFRSALIFDEAVLVGVTGAVDPGQPRLDGRPQVGQRRLVAGALEIASRQQDEQARASDAAVILPDRYPAQRRHLAAAP